MRLHDSPDFSYKSAKFIIMMILTLLMGGGTSFLSSYSPPSVGFFIFIGCLYYMMKHTDINYGFSRLTNTLVIVCTWMFIHWFSAGGYTDTGFIMVGLCVLMAFFIINFYRSSMLDYYEEVAYILALIGLIGWIINNLIGSEMMAFLAPFETSEFNNALHSSLPTGSFIFYSIGAWKGAQELPIELYRNQGYCWEAGRFASLTVLGLVIYLLQNKGSLPLKRKRFWVYILTLLSTFSTTGYVTTLVMIGLFLLYNKGLNLYWKLVLGVLFIGVVVNIQSLNFITDKIDSQLDVSTFHSAAGRETSRSTVTITADRFEGIYLDWLNFIHAPILGYGMTDNWSYMQQEISSSLITANGLTKVFARCGFLLGFLYFLLFYRGSACWVEHYGFRFKPVLFIAILMISISYDFSFLPLILAIVFYDLYGIKSDVEKEDADEEDEEESNDSSSLDYPQMTFRR